MPAEFKNTKTPERDMSVAEILFGTLLGIGAIGCIWVSSSLMIHLIQNLN